MRIHDAHTKISHGVAHVQGQTRGPSSPSDIDGAAEPRQGVRVSLSRRAQELAANARADEAKIARLREAVEKGTLEIDPRAIAARIVEENG
jgi:flagellar biosynthesis anti-sigma factor FlgM